jgi:HEPN domain-containing protein
MAEVDLSRAKSLLRSARELFELGETAGVAGLAYQAFESATMFLLEEVNGSDGTTHSSRQARAKALLRRYGGEVDFIWRARNIDFYGNVRLGEKKEELSRDDAKRALSLIGGMLEEVEALIEEGSRGRSSS